MAPNALTGLIFDAAVDVAGIVWTLSRKSVTGVMINVAIAVVLIGWTANKYYVSRQRGFPPRKRGICRRDGWAERCKVVTKL